ncbi:MAG: hypothetical protein CL471_17490 [Acidobacteria bacterium]|nr:hypothetical protein [Acidobacteriota bacterium]
MRRWPAWICGLFVGLGVVMAPSSATAQIPFGEQRYEYALSDVLPAAIVFDRVETYWKGYASEARVEVVGYVFLTDDLVDIPGYSGESMNTLVGMNADGAITGVKIVRHSEPIVLIGLPEATIHEFTNQYPGKQITDRILISREPTPDYVTVDGISGATVTAVAENATILEASRLVGRAEGIVSAAQVRTRRPSDEFQPFSWPQLASRGAIGSITVEPEELGLIGPANAVDVRFAVLDPPSVGRNLVGERFYDIVRGRLDRDGGSALYIGGLGDLSFKGAGFARGGIFDRFVLEQSGDLVVFRDLNYLALPIDDAARAPSFREGGVFFTDDGFDPTQPFTFRLTVPYRVRDERRYATFVADHELPARFVDADLPFWVSRWQASWASATFTALLLASLLAAFTFRQRLLLHRKLLHRSTALLAAVGLGVLLKAQPSTTQILTLFGSASRLEFPSEIFLSEPLIFLLWIVIAGTLVLWGRGFFCGWVCPYGALLEVLISLWEKAAPEALRNRFDKWKPPRYLRYGKIAVFAFILAVSFVSLPLAEAINEVEPFKTFVLDLARPWAFVLYFAVITLVSVPSYRFFCRFLCPLGGALAIPSTKAPLLPLLRYESCTRCWICAKGCEPKAISFETGRINYQECLQCWDCLANGADETLCPELIVAKRKQRPVRVLAASLLLTLLAWPAVARAGTMRVRPGMLADTLQQAQAGDVLLLEPGVHVGALHIKTPITVRGQAGAIIDGGGTGHVIIIDAPGVTVENLTIRHCRISEAFTDSAVWVEQDATGARVIGNTIEACRFGIWVHGTAEAEVAGNRVAGLQQATQNQRGDCVHLWDADGIRVTDNDLSSCRDGVYMELTSEAIIDRNRITDSRYAIHTMWCDQSRYLENYAYENLVGLALMFSKEIEARQNILHNNRTHGILWVQVTYGTATDNVVIGNTKGLFVYNSLYNTIRGNLVARNNLGGHYWGGSEENVMEANAFIENEIQVKFIAGKDQTWVGNYWSDYGGWDLDGDDRGEVPYRSNTLVDALLYKHPSTKFLLTSPAFQVLALAEREFPIITVPKVVDPSPRMSPSMTEWAKLLAQYPAAPTQYYLEMEKLPHLPGGQP